MSSLKAYAHCPKCNKRSRFSPGDMIENCKSCGSKLPPSEIEAVKEKLRGKQIVKTMTGRKIK